jgi:hypothetical protein
VAGTVRWVRGEEYGIETLVANGTTVVPDPRKGRLQGQQLRDSEKRGAPLVRKPDSSG